MSSSANYDLPIKYTVEAQTSVLRITVRHLAFLSDPVINEGYPGKG